MTFGPRLGYNWRWVQVCQIRVTSYLRGGVGWSDLIVKTGDKGGSQNHSISNDIKYGWPLRKICKPHEVQGTFNG